MLFRSCDRLRKDLDNRRGSAMKRLLIGLVMMCGVSTCLAAGAILIEYEGDTHRVAEILGKTPGLLTRDVIPRRPGVGYVGTRHTVPAGKIRVRLQMRGGEVDEIELSDPRVFRAPMALDGSGHGPVLLKERGAYINLRFRDQEQGRQNNNPSSLHFQ